MKCHIIAGPQLGTPLRILNDRLLTIESNSFACFSSQRVLDVRSLTLYFSPYSASSIAAGKY